MPHLKDTLYGYNLNLKLKSPVFEFIIFCFYYHKFLLAKLK
jgi:hypothetical protein